MTSLFNERQWVVLQALSDTVVPGLTYDKLDAACPESPEADKRRIANTGCGHYKGYRQAVEALVSGVSPAKQRLLGLVLNCLAFRVTAAPLTRSHKLFTEMTLSERESVLRSWQYSPIGQLNMLAAQMFDLAMFSFYYNDPEQIRAVGYKFENPVYEKIITSTPLFIPKFVDSLDNQFDVVIIGSGCGGGVAAYEAAKAGFRVLIVEKGDYIRPEELPKNPRLAEERTFEMAGACMSDDGSMNILAGSTVGGGGAVNWSCSLKTPLGIRKEWAQEVPWYNTPLYDEAMDYICGAMGVTTDIGAPHSFTNQLILDSAKKLDYPAKEAPQNTGKHPYNNRFHGFGYRKGENGGVAVWLDVATQHGAQMVTSALARRIVRKSGKATGVELEIDGKRHFVKAKRVVSAAGSLNTPGLLLRSGFSNKHIGRHLKLHPVTCLYGDYDEVVNRNDDPIMTTVSTVSDNLDGRHHGPKIEAIHHSPHLIGKFLPWNNGQDYAFDLARYAHLSCLLVITRDAGEGRVYVDKSMPYSPSVEYSTSKYDLWALVQGCLIAADMQYMGGAKRIIVPTSGVPDFHSSKPKENRRATDEDFQEWREKLAKVTFYNNRVRLGSAHQMASCRMSARGSSYGAVDGRGRLYECKNVHVIDASVFPSASGVNPMISTISTAKVLADELVKSLKGEASKARL